MLVNNAGVFEAVADDADDDDWHAAWARTLTINLQATADLSRLAIAHFRERGGGRIVNVASRAAYRGDSPQHWHYAASKAGMIGMTKTIARGYAAEDILAFAVCPGFTMTGMAEDYLASRGGDKLLADIPLGRVADADEVAETIRWLAIDAPAVGDRRGDRHQRRQLCSLALARARARRPADHHPARQAAAPGRAPARADRANRARTGPRRAGNRRLGQARPAGPHPRQHLSRRHLRHFARSSSPAATATC